MSENKILMKNNSLIKARYNLNLVQSNFFITILYKLQRYDNGEGFCYISQEEFQSLSNNKNYKTLAGIRRVLNSLMEERIYFKEEKNNGKNSIWGEYNLISGFEFDDEIKEFKIVCSSRVYDLLMNYMQIGYTPINLLIYLSLKSPYSQRMYDLLRLWSNSKKNIEYEVSELKELMMLENKYDVYTNFKKKVLDKSIGELNATGYFEIEYSEIKKNRKVTSIKFNVKDMDKRVYFKKPDEAQEDLETTVEENIPDDIKVSNDINISNEPSKKECIGNPNELVFFDKFENMYTAEEAFLHDIEIVRSAKRGDIQEIFDTYVSNDARTSDDTYVSNDTKASIDTNSFTEYELPRYEYIPEEGCFNFPVRMLIKKDFWEYDFKDEQYLNDAFYDALTRVLEKENKEQITTKEYGYFKKTLAERIEYHTRLDINKHK